ncbi:MAG: PAS domain S-box protein [Sphaerobacteraceae bacterium]|nr:MAG: PAS domain S-box protein [Sphaerobacteraceae bacterium]
MAPPSNDHDSTPNQTVNDRHDESSLRSLLELVERSLDGPHALLVLSNADESARIVDNQTLNLTDVCRERLIAAIEGSDISTATEFDLSTVVTDTLIFEGEQPNIRWMAAALEDGGALVACAEDPWEPGDREHATLLGFARLIGQYNASTTASSISDHARLRDLIAESARDGVIGIDTDGRCRYINQAGADLIGSDPDDVISMPVSSLFHLPESAEQNDLLAAAEREATEFHEVQLNRPDGLSFPVELTVVPNVEASGEVNGAVVRFADLRDQKAAVVAVEQSEARHQAFLEMTLDSIITISQQGRILEFNLAAEETFRCFASEVIGRDITETLIHEHWHEWWTASFQSFSRDGGGPLNGRRVQITAVRRDGSDFPAEFTLTRIPMRDSWVYTLYIHDLTEEKWNDRRRSTRYAVTHILAETESPRSALPDVLAAVCEGLEWDWAACWVRQPGSNEMKLDLTWNVGQDSVHPLEAASEENGFGPGYGFLGQIWTRQTADWIEDMAEPNPYRRSESALESGFRSVAAMPIIGRNEIIGIIEFQSRQRRERDPEMLRMFDSLGSQIGQFIERKQVEEERVQILAREQSARAEAEAAERRLAFLAEASAQLSASLDFGVTLSNVARLAVPRLADYCAIDMLQDDNQIQSLELADVNPEKEEIGRQMHEDHPVDPESNHPVAQVLRSGRPILFSDVDDDVLQLFAENDEAYLAALRDIGIDSAMYVPLVARGRTIGVISFVASESGERYGPSDLALAQELTRRAAMAIDNARLYREAQDAVRIREEFLSIASHELKTPLTTVKGYGQILSRLLRRPTTDPDRLIRLADQLQEQLSRFETLIADLLDVSRIQQRGLELRPEPTDLVELVRMVVSRFEYPAEPDPRHHFVISGPEEMNGVWDPDRLDQVLTNLISNAVKYSPDGGAIGITISEAENDQVEFAVIDQGIGIPEEEQSQLFRPFARSETVQRAISGVGLGLYISQQIVTRHGGIIWLESEPGIGSRFAILLPREYTAISEEIIAQNESETDR